ncbi:MAG: UDP-N-acetylglucosamine--N-acetylmuramyl-(pentapeptide) pyrophosphoryl-undecaprenol N-acetylglucosamine transferase [Egibacteraceae bacterium]
MKAGVGKRARTILVTGGNTGGHVIPNIPVIAGLRKAGWSVHYVGDPDGLEARLIPGLGVPFHALKSGKLRRYLSVRNVTDIARTIIAVVRSLLLVARLRPLVVYSKGGFVAVPVMIAAWMLRVPVIAHESDRSLSLTGRIALRIAHRVCCGLPPLVVSEKMIYTGVPLRSDLTAGSPARVREALRLDERSVLLVVGGSLGAASIDHALKEALPRLLQTFQIIHLSPAPAPAEGLSAQGYHPIPNDYERFPDLLAVADVVLCRAGATTVAELVATCTPALLVPLPTSASRGEQLANARYVLEQGYGEYVEQDGLSPAVLEKALRQLLERGPEYRENMKGAEIPDGTGAVLRVIAAAVS